MVQRDTLLSNTYAILWISTSHANGRAIRLYASMDGQPVGTYPNALHQQRRGSIDLLCNSTHRFGNGEYRYDRHWRHPLAGHRQYGDNIDWNLCFPSLYHYEQRLFADIQRQLNIAQLNAAYPPRHIFRL